MDLTQITNSELGLSNLFPWTESESIKDQNSLIDNYSAGMSSIDDFINSLGLSYYDPSMLNNNPEAFRLYQESGIAPTMEGGGLGELWNSDPSSEQDLLDFYNYDKDPLIPLTSDNPLSFEDYVNQESGISVGELDGQVSINGVPWSFDPYPLDPIGDFSYAPVNPDVNTEYFATAGATPNASPSFLDKMMNFLGGAQTPGGVFPATSSKPSNSGGSTTGLIPMAANAYMGMQGVSKMIGMVLVVIAVALLIFLVRKK